MNHNLYDKLNQREEDLKSGKISKEDVVDSLQRSGLLDTDGNVVNLTKIVRHQRVAGNIWYSIPYEGVKGFYYVTGDSSGKGGRILFYDNEVSSEGLKGVLRHYLDNNGATKVGGMYSPETAERFKQLNSVSTEELAFSYREGYGICQDSIG